MNGDSLIRARWLATRVEHGEMTTAEAETALLEFANGNLTPEGAADLIGKAQQDARVLGSLPGWPGTATAPEPDRGPCLCDLCRWAIDLGSGYDGPCRCDTCRYGQRPGTGVTLYDREDGEWMRIQAGLRDGWLEDYAAHHIAAARTIDAEFDLAAERSLRRFETLYRRVEAARRAA
jgi:hypothetical protein